MPWGRFFGAVWCLGRKDGRGFLDGYRGGSTCSKTAHPTLLFFFFLWLLLNCVHSGEGKDEMWESFVGV